MELLRIRDGVGAVLQLLTVGREVNGVVRNLRDAANGDDPGPQDTHHRDPNAGYRGEVAAPTSDRERKTDEEEPDGEDGQHGDVRVRLVAVVVGLVGEDLLAQLLAMGSRCNWPSSASAPLRSCTRVSAPTSRATTCSDRSRCRTNRLVGGSLSWPGARWRRPPPFEQLVLHEHVVVETEVGERRQLSEPAHRRDVGFAARVVFEVAVLLVEVRNARAAQRDEDDDDGEPPPELRRPRRVRSLGLRRQAPLVTKEADGGGQDEDDNGRRGDPRSSAFVRVMVAKVSITTTSTRTIVHPSSRWLRLR